MKIVSADYATSAAKPGQFPRDGRPEIAFVGRSNVGKSTMLNTLLNRHELAKTSKKPGKTRLVNFFDINGSLYFVDLPGYGFAKVSKQTQAEWAALISSYLLGRKPLRLVCHLIDARHEPTPRDHDLLDLLEKAEVPILIIATKVDKLSASERARVERRIRDSLGLDDDALVIPYSSVTKQGKNGIWDTIDSVIA